jgi:membrane-associated protein
MNVDSLIINFGLLGIWLILFAESGLLFGFFLPGDSLLIAAGLLAAKGGYFGIVPLVIVCISAAIIGDSVGYEIGKKTGKRIKNNKNNFIVKMGYLAEAESFYKRHGGKTIILARFVPAVRSFVPMVAGMSDMAYRDFIKFNVLGGILWGGGLSLVGYKFGNIPWVEHNLELIIIAVIAVTTLPGLMHLLGSKQKRDKLKAVFKEAAKGIRNHKKDKNKAGK